MCSMLLSGVITTTGTSVHVFDIVFASHTDVPLMIKDTGM